MKYLIAILISILALSACQDPGATGTSVVVTKPADSPKPLAAPEPENTPGEESIVVDPVILRDLPPAIIDVSPEPSIPTPPPAASNSSEPDLSVAQAEPVPAPTPAAAPTPVLKPVTLDAHMSLESTNVTVEAPKPVIIDAHMSLESTSVTVEAPKPVIVEAHKSIETTDVTVEAPKPVIVNAHMSVETTTVTVEAPKPVIVEAYKSIETTDVSVEAPKPVIVQAHKSTESTVVTVEAPKPVIVQAHKSTESTVVTVEAPVAPVEIAAAPIEPATATPVPAAPDELVFSPKDLLGKGAFGEVYRGQFNGAVVAIKKFIPDPRSNASAQASAWKLFQEEIRIMSDLRSPNIVAVCGVTEHENRTCLLLECAPSGSLNVLLAKAKRDGEKFSEMNQLQWCKDIAAGTDYLHQRGIIHRDIKAANVLVFPAAHPATKYNMKLADFGFALDTATNKSAAEVFCGSIPWMAPERADLDNVVCTEKSDVYSEGMVFWEIVAQSTPRVGTNNWRVALRNIRNAAEETRQQMPKDVPQTLREIIVSCWKTNPNARPDAKTVSETLGNRIQEISDEEAARLVAAAQVRPPAEPAAPSVEVAPEPEPAPELRQIEVVQPSAPKEPVIEKTQKPVAKLPNLGRLARAFDWLGQRLDETADWMNETKPKPASINVNSNNVFEVVEITWWGQQKRLLRVTKTYLERINPTNNEVRSRVAIRKLDRLEVSANNDILRLIYEGPNKGEGVADEYATTDANAIVESIKTARPRIRVVTLQ